METTGTGFPKVFYLNNDMYRNTWPLLALGPGTEVARPRRPASANGAQVGPELRQFKR